MTERVQRPDNVVRAEARRVILEGRENTDEAITPEEKKEILRKRGYGTSASNQPIVIRTPRGEITYL